MERTHANESATDTMKYIDAHRNWMVAEQRYQVHYGSVMNTPLSKCKVYQRGLYLIVELNGIIHFWEHTQGNTCYLQDAIGILDISKPKDWKTLDALITLRQCCRECIAQGWGVEDIYFVKGISQTLFKEFLQIGRRYDKVHHGSNTF